MRLPNSSLTSLSGTILFSINGASLWSREPVGHSTHKAHDQNSQDNHELRYLTIVLNFGLVIHTLEYKLSSTMPGEAKCVLIVYEEMESSVESHVLA